MRILFTTFEGGGHVTPMLIAALAMQARGETVLVLSDEANRTQAQAAGLQFRSWVAAPNRTTAGASDDPLTDWRQRWPPKMVRTLCSAIIAGPSSGYSADLIEAAKDFEPDLVVSNELLFGVIAACESLKLPVALLTANLWCFPDRKALPPFGPGWGPVRNAFEARRERLGRDMIARWYDAGLKDLNRTRRTLDLPPLERTLHQLRSVRLRIIGTSAAFDFAGPDDLHVYAGPLIDLHPTQAPHELIDRNRPNVLISFSTTFQGQTAVMRRCAQALSGLGRNIVVTTGPAISPAVFEGLRDVRAAAYAPHDAIVPFCEMVLCHGGHGTLMRPLMLGRPVLCLPMGRDHPDNAVRLVRRGAGRALPNHSSRRAIRRTAMEMMASSAYADNARELGLRIRQSAAHERHAAFDALSILASEGR